VVVVPEVGLSPLFEFLLLLPLGPGDSGTTDWVRVLLVETIAYVIGWTAFPLVILPVTRILGRESLWLDFIIVYNWSQVLQYGAILAIIAVSLSGLAPPVLQGGLLYLAYLAVFAYELHPNYAALGTCVQKVQRLDQSIGRDEGICVEQ